MVCFRLLGILVGCATLRGKLEPFKDDDMGPNAIKIIFDRPRICFGAAVFEYGPRSTVRIATTYLDDRIRIGIGSRGSLFVFVRGGLAETKMADEWNYIFQARPLPPALLVVAAIGVLALTFLAPWSIRIGALIFALMFGFVMERGGTARDDQSVLAD